MITLVVRGFDGNQESKCNPNQFFNVTVINISFPGLSQEIVSFNLREEPVIFVGLNHDFVPYSPRDPTSLKGNIANHGVKPEELAETELKIREEVNLSTFVLLLFCRKI